MAKLIKLKRVYLEDERDYDEWPYYEHRRKLIVKASLIGLIISIALLIWRSI